MQCRGRSYPALRAPGETRGVFHTAFPVPEKHGTWETLVFGQHAEEAAQLPAQPAPNVCMVPCPLGPADPSAVPWLQHLFSDPITYSSMDFSCLDLIILNPLYLIIGSPAWPDTKLPGGSPAALQKDNLPLVYAPGGGCSAEQGRVPGTVQDRGKAAPPAPPVLQPHKSEKRCRLIDYPAAAGVHGDAHL